MNEAQQNWDRVPNCSPSEIGSFIDICVKAIFETNIGSSNETSTGFAIVPLPNSSQHDFGNYTVDKIVELCLTQYVQTFSMKVRQWSFNDQIPLYSDCAIIKFHEDSVTSSQNHCEFILMHREDTNGSEVIEKLNGSLEKMLDQVKKMNYRRRDEVLEKIRSLLKKDFFDRCKQKYDAIVLNLDNCITAPQTKFYDQSRLDEFLDNTLNKPSGILDYQTRQLYKGVDRDAEDTRLLRVRQDAISTIQSCMTEESKRISNGNKKNLERAQKEAEKYVAEVKSLQGDVKASLDKDCYEQAILEKMRKDTEARLQKIRQLFASNALEMQNRTELASFYMEKANKVYLDCVQYAQGEKRKFTDLLHRLENKKLSAMIDSEGKKVGVSVEPWKRYLELLQDTTKHHRTVELSESVGNNGADGPIASTSGPQPGSVAEVRVRICPVDGAELKRHGIAPGKTGNERTEKRAKR